MAFVYDQAATSAVWGAINTSGQAAYAIPGGFKMGGVSGNTPIAYDPEVVKPYLDRVKAGGVVVAGGLTLPASDPAGAYYQKLYGDAFAAVTPREPHPDASDQSKGPNLGGEDALKGAPPSGAPPAGPPASSGSGLGGLVLIGGAVLLLVKAFGRKK